MAVLFTIPGDDTQYRYPESSEDITLGQYIAYLRDVAPTHPPCMTAIDEATAEVARLVDEVTALVPDAPAHYPDAVKFARAYLDRKPTGKARKYLPGVLDQLDAAAAARQSALDAVTQVVYSTEVLPFYARVVAHFTGLTLARVLGTEGPPMRYDDVEAIYARIVRAIEDSPDPNEDNRAIIFQGAAYMLPDRFMEKSTVIEFAEAAQFQSAAKDAATGHWESLIDVCAVLLRPAGVSYDEEGYAARRALFVDLPLADAMRVAFFLMRQSAAYAQSFQASTLAHHLARLKLELQPSSMASAGT